MTKAEKIAEMLRRFEEARETAGRNGMLGDGSSWPRMPKTWNASYRELERCLQRMRESKGSLIVCADGMKRSPRALYWHVTERFLRSELRTVSMTVKDLRELKSPAKPGKPKFPRWEHFAGDPTPSESRLSVRVLEWSSQVSPAAVNAGLEWLAEEFQGEPYLPVEMVAA